MNDVYGMNTAEGNELVQHIVIAAVKLYQAQGATYTEAAQFIKARLDQLSKSDDYKEADSNDVRMSAYYDLQDATKEIA